MRGPRVALSSAPAVLKLTYAVFVVAFLVAAVSTFTDTRWGLVPLGVAGAQLGLVVSGNAGGSLHWLVRRAEHPWQQGPRSAPLPGARVVLARVVFGFFTVVGVARTAITIGSGR